jgi:hypothetical protein
MGLLKKQGKTLIKLWRKRAKKSKKNGDAIKDKVTKGIEYDQPNGYLK